MTGIFRQKTPANIILLIILGVLLKLPSFFHAKGYILKKADSDLFQFIISCIAKVTGDKAFSYVLVALFVNFTIAFVLVNFLNSDRYMHRPNYLAGMAYVLISSFLPSFNLLSSNLIASLFLLLTFRLLLRSHNVKIEKNNIFNVGLFISIASLFFLPALLFLLWAYIAIAILRPFRIKEWIILLIGFITPYYFYAAYLYVTDHFSIPKYIYHFSFLTSKVQYTLWHAGALFLFLAPLLAGLYYFQVNSSKMIVHIRKGWYLFVVYLFISIPISFFNSEKTLENIILLLVPVSAFHGYGYLNAEVKLYPKISFWVAAAFIILSQVFSNLW